MLRPDSLQPSLTAVVAARWIRLTLVLWTRIAPRPRRPWPSSRSHNAADHYRTVLRTSPARHRRGIRRTANWSWHRVDGRFRCAPARGPIGGVIFPLPRQRIVFQGFAALRADDPAAAVRELQRGRLRADRCDASPDSDTRRELTQGLWRARILAGDADEPLSQCASCSLERECDAREPASTMRCCYCAAQRGTPRQPRSFSLSRLCRSPLRVAVRLLALVEFQDGKLDAAGRRFAELGLTMGEFVRRFLLLLRIDRGAARRSGTSIALVRAGAERR